MAKTKLAIPPPAPEIWTSEEVAVYLRCTKQHVTNLARRGEIPGKQLGTIWRFRRQDIEDLFRKDVDHG